ncbi:MAG: hypothetical protein C4297_07010 [Gemmataceae bacterium]
MSLLALAWAVSMSLVGGAPEWGWLMRLQRGPRLVYAMPAPGNWAEYQFREQFQGRSTEGVLRLACVGASKEGYWLECRLDQVRPEPMRATLKLLVSPLLSDNVSVGYFQKAGQPVVRLTEQECEHTWFLGHPLQLRGPIKIEVEPQEVTTSAGKFATRVGRLTLGDQAPGGIFVGGFPMIQIAHWDYRVWLSADVPFGWVKAEIRHDGQLLLQAQLVRRGSGARSELDETQAPAPVVKSPPKHTGEKKK